MSADDLEFLMAPDRLLLVESVQVHTIVGFKIGSPDEPRPQLHIAFMGRINNSQEQAEVWVAMSPEDAFRNLAVAVIEAIERAMRKDGKDFDAPLDKEN